MNLTHLDRLIWSGVKMEGSTDLVVRTEQSFVVKKLEEKDLKVQRDATFRLPVIRLI